MTDSQRDAHNSSRKFDAEPVASSQAPADLSETTEKGARPLASSSASQASAVTASKPSRNTGVSNSRLQTVKETEQPNNFEGVSRTEKALKTRSELDNHVSTHTRNEDAVYQSASDHDSRAHGGTDRIVPSAMEVSSVKDKASSAPLPAKVRNSNAERLAKPMVVETETVSSIPQTAVTYNNGDRSQSTRPEASDTVVKKQSSDTMRAKKDRKSRKPPSIMSATGSSKADVFEAKVASEIEGEDTDSDETFVYESNPSERRSHRTHSRTPSTASVRSLLDRRGAMRSLANSVDSQRTIRGKRSMKFASSSFANTNSSIENEAGDRGKRRGAGLSPCGRSVTDSAQSKVVARSRKIESALHSPVENLSPFSKVAALRTTGSTFSRRPASLSPRLTTPTRLKNSREHHGSSEADSSLKARESFDEQDPLLLTSPSSGSRSRQWYVGLPSDEYESLRSYRSARKRRLTSCVLLVLIALLVMVCGAAVVLAATSTLCSVSLEAIQNVLASEQELMLDLLVSATNPNILPITIENADVNVFAKSPYVASDVLGEDCLGEDCISYLYGNSFGATDAASRPSSTSVHFHTRRDSIDEGTDPVDGPDIDGQTMLLGRVFHFDSALTFESSFLLRQATNSSAALRLERPGNKTETGGSQRWERVIEHPFQLIVRGVLKYQLPLSTRTSSRSIGASVMIRPGNEFGTLR